MTWSDSYLGIIEGFFGKSWTFKERIDYADFLQNVGYQFYIYAPKSDSYLRKSWQNNWPIETEKQIQKLVKTYHEKALDFGVGLSPFEIYKNYDQTAQDKLADKIQYLNQFNLDVICLLFDDMRGDISDLAKTQIQITKDVLTKTNANKVIMCPTYYSFDPVLEKVFGQMPDNYLEDLGSGLPKEVDIFWTGPKVCSNNYPDQHLKDVEKLLQRKPFLWDNYPVNDGAKMCKHLHIKPFENRNNQLASLTSGHAVNPMNQSYLSRIPLQSLPVSYEQEERYSTESVLQKCLESNCSDTLAKQLAKDIETFQYKGLEGLPNKNELIKTYQSFNCEYSAEIVAWLKGEYTFDPDCLTD